jgi:hypothetical protein
MSPPPGLPRPPSGRIYLGWQYAALHPDPGPPPRRPVPPEHPEVNKDWLAAQWREENRLDRAPKNTVIAAAVTAIALIATAVAGWVPAPVVAVAAAACAAAAAGSARAVWRGRRAVLARIEDEKARVEKFRADSERKLYAWQDEHARQVKEWRVRRFAFDGQKHWYAVPLPPGIDRVDVAGGTLPGWSALLTMAGAYRLAAGGEVTVLDLSGGSVAADLIAVAHTVGIDPAVWVLPADLSRLDLTSSLEPAALAEVLATSVAAASGPAGASGAASSGGAEGRDLALDNSIVGRVLSVLGQDISMPRVAAGLRAIAQVGDPHEDIAAGLLTEAEASELTVMFGRGAADRVTVERALALESQVRVLASAASNPGPVPRGGLRVVAVDGPAGPAASRILSSFAVTALTRMLAGEPPAGQAWRHALFLLGAERLREDVLDGLTAACETSGTGLVVAYRSLPPHVRQRIGRGNAAVAFMRLGNAEDAKSASEQIGTEHRFMLSQLTETVGTSVTDTTGASYTSTVGDSSSLAASGSASDSVSEGSGHGRSAESGFLPSAGSRSRSAESGSSRGASTGESVTAGISSSTAWGASTSRATGGSESQTRSLHRSREFLVEASELQRLPPTALILSYATAAGRRVLMADANPAIGGLADATTTPLAEAGRFRATAPPQPEPAPADQPNLGAPAERLDWRKH